MEQQEEKKTTSQSNSSLPLDLASQIHLNLPAKSIVRFRCVSKLWSSITTDSYFINSFETRSSSKPSLLMFFKNSKKMFVFSFPQHHHKNSNEPFQSYSSQPLDRYQIKLSRYISFSYMESGHGLICFQDTSNGFDEKLMIWNPTMRQFLTLPKPARSWRNIGITFFFGYDPIDRKHKVVCMPGFKFCDECRVLTLGSSSSSSWRRIKTNFHHNPSPAIQGNGRCINGVLYYKASLDHIENRVVMSFDVRSETFKPIKVPSDTQWESLISYEGRLAFVHSEYTNNGTCIRLCILEDAEKHEWSHRFFHVPFNSYDRSSKKRFKLSGVTDTGEFIYVSSKTLKSFCVLYFDPKRNRFKEVVFDGIADDELRLSNGFGNDPIKGVYAFPNHIESLISL